MVDPSVCWQLWNAGMSEDEAAEEINKGRKFLNSATKAYYLDLPYGHISLKDCYNYNPVYKNIAPENADKLIGEYKRTHEGWL